MQAYKVYTIFIPTYFTLQMKILRYLKAKDLALGLTGSVAELGCTQTVSGTKSTTQITASVSHTGWGLSLHPLGVHVLSVQWVL